MAELQAVWQNTSIFKELTLMMIYEKAAKYTNTIAFIIRINTLIKTHSLRPSDVAGHLKVGFATSPDLLMKSTWVSLFSAHISITLPTYHFLSYPAGMHWLGFWHCNIRSRFNHIFQTWAHMCLCFVIYCQLTVFPALGHKYMVWCCTWYGPYTLKADIRPLL